MTSRDTLPAKEPLNGGASCLLKSARRLSTALFFSNMEKALKKVKVFSWAKEEAVLLEL